MKRATLKDIQQTSTIDTNNMTTEQLRNLVGNAADIANKRIKRLEGNEWGKNSIAYQKWQEAGSKPFSTKGKNEGQLKAEFKRVKNFLAAETSSIRGQKQVRKRIEEKIGRKFKNADEESAFWEGYKKWEAREKDKGYVYESNGAVTAYGTTSEVDITNKMEELHPKYLNEKGELEVNRSVYVDPESGEELTEEQAYEVAEALVIRDKTDKYIIARPEHSALSNYSFDNEASLGGN